MIAKRENELFIPQMDENLDKTYEVEDELIVNMILNGKEKQDINLFFNIYDNAKLKIVIFDFARHNIETKIHINALENTDVRVYLATSAKKTDIKHFEINVDNKMPRSYSLVKMYGTNEDQAKIVFDGVTRIYKGAKKCNVRQEGRIIDFDENVDSSVSPSLCIDENDIQASHGAILGQIPTSTLFYLTSRGLTIEEAQKLLSNGYFIPLRKEIDSEVVGEIVDSLLENL